MTILGFLGRIVTTTVWFGQALAALVNRFGKYALFLVNPLLGLLVGFRVLPDVTGTIGGKLEQLFSTTATNLQNMYQTAEALNSEATFTGLSGNIGYILHLAAIPEAIGIFLACLTIAVTLSLSMLSAQFAIEFAMFVYRQVRDWT